MVNYIRKRACHGNESALEGTEEEDLQKETVNEWNVKCDYVEDIPLNQNLGLLQVDGKGDSSIILFSGSK